MMRTRIGAAIVLLLATGSIAAAGDWPMWRHDAARSNRAPDALPADLHLHWVRQFPAPRPAWPASQSKLQFDSVYRPIVAGKLIIVGSTVNDAVAAYDTRSGEEVWRFYTDGPVRFAPVAHEGKLYVASDDGYVYCLKLDTAELLWKRNGGPSDRCIIGNDRLISSWPIRGGLVVDDGAVYFTASIWPFMGVFVHALDAQSGDSLWINSETGSEWVTHPHGAPSFGSIVPQGYLAVSGDRLIVPGGRSLPAVLDRHTGQVQHFEFGGKGSGGWDVAANDRFYVVGNALLDLQDGSELDARAADIIAPDLLIDRMTAYSLQDVAVQEIKAKDRRGRDIVKRQLNLPAPWQIGASQWRTLCMAGEFVYAARDEEIACFDLAAARESARPTSPLWSAKIDGSPVGCVAADDRLFVITDDAKILCFGAGESQLKEFRLQPESLPQSNQKWNDVAGAILQHDGADQGYAVACSAGTGSLIEEMLSRTSLHIIVIDPDAEKIDSLRRRWDAAGLYGTRVVAHVGDPATFNLPPYMANLVFSEHPPHTENSTVEEITALYKPLRPYGGIAAWPTTNRQHEILSQAAQDAHLQNAIVQRENELTLLKREGALPGAADWTHQYADAANSVVSQDTLVKAPLGLLWFGGPPNDKVLPRHGHGPSPQVAGGRLVIEGADMLRCVDVYTGRVLWERDLPGLGAYYDVTSHFPGAGEIGSNYVTLPDAVYVVYGDAILDLNPSTGQTRREFTLQPDAENPHPSWGFLAVDGDYLVATSSPVAVDSGQEKSTKAAPPIPAGTTPLVKPGASWSYLAGSDPSADWKANGFRPGETWRSGPAGFGYGDGDDRTVLNDMHGRYTRVYVRTTFDGAAARNAEGLTLAVNYDDAFIAYLNGKEIARVGVGAGEGASAKGVKSHEADGYEMFEVENFRSLLAPGENVLALEGHNAGADSSDFTLDPYLLIKSAAPPPTTTPDTPAASIAASLDTTRYSSASRRLVVFDRQTGRELWSRTAEFNFRHNAIAVAAGKVFCIDCLSESKIQTLKRRGVKQFGAPQLLALDARTGEVVWSTEENVFGTFLNYSQEHDILLQAGSKYRDRATDEIGQGMVAYRGATGDVLWQDLERSYGGPCLLWQDKIITNGGGGYRLNLLTGAETDWKYTRMYGCNTAVGSQHLLTFRSGAAGYCDLTGDSGTGNIGGFRSSCTSNLIVADGVLNAPDYTRTCTCAYQNQSSLALIHMPEAEMWTFSSLNAPPETFGVNLGAAGDRRDEAGTIWYEAPSIGGESPDLPVTIAGRALRSVRHHSSIISESSSAVPDWIASSCVVGVESIRRKLPPAKDHYTVRLKFAELEHARAGERLFDVVINGQTVLNDFDIAAETGGKFRGIVKEFANIEATGGIEIKFVSTKGEPCVSGVLILPE